MDELKRDFVQLLRKAIGQPFVLSNSINWNGVWNLALSHHLESMVYLSAAGERIPNNLRETMSQTYAKMQRRTVLQDHYINKIELALNEMNISYAIQKGSLIRKDYPNLYSRFMSDVDFYIKTEDRPLIREAMMSIGAEFRGEESGDEQYVVGDYLGVEFHGRLLYRLTNNGIYNYPDWSFVDVNQNRLTEEGFALNLIGHAVGDLACGGPGIRYILDLWIYRHVHKPQPDWRMVFERFKHDNVFFAASNLLDLSDYLFGNGLETDLIVEMADYVLQGGLHGSYKRSLLSQATGGKGKAFLKQLFRNSTELENRYPWLKDKHYLLPAAWLIRASKSIRVHRVAIKKWVVGMDELSKAEIKQQKQRLKRFGL